MISLDTKFLIVGLGLLGGCYAKALKKNGYTVYALEINEQSIRYANDHHLVDKISPFDQTLVKEADIVIFGLYPTKIKPWLNMYQQFLKPNCLITDVSGVKCKIVDEIQQILREDVEFIGSHPMAGREVSGVQYSDPTIFKGANFIITPTTKNTNHAISTVYKLAEILGFASISVLSPQKHDEMIGFVSQLTHVIAVSLMNTNDNTHLVDYTGDSFRDLTRIAKINDELWTELFILNKENLVKEISDFEATLAQFKEILIQEDTQRMKHLFQQSTSRRKLFDRKEKSNENHDH